MADEKFSEFTVATNTEGLQLVGLRGGENVQIPWETILGAIGFVPLSGTEENKPITGDMELSGGGSDIGIVQVQGTVTKRISFADDSTVSLSVTDSSNGETAAFTFSGGGMSFNTNNATATGLFSSEYFENKDPNTYAQMKDITQGTVDIEIADPNAGVILRSPNNSRWRITVDNAGVINATPV